MMTQSKLDWGALAGEAEKLQEWIAERRRHLHRQPELSFQEEKTAQYLRHEMSALGYHTSEPVAEGRYGFYADLHAPSNPDQYVVLRADIDALPIEEENDVEFKSERPGVGHLCGHDAHASMLLGAAALLRDRQDDLPISVRFVFQHAEEVPPGGARDFVEAGLLKDAVGCFGLHVSPRLEKGLIGLSPGEVMAAAGIFHAVIRGSGGHGAAPHEGIDPILPAAQVVSSLQHIVSRMVPFHQSAVVSVCSINGGTAPNVIPNEVKLSGTFRAYNEILFRKIEDRIRETITNTASAFGCESELQIDRGYPALVNDESAFNASYEATSRLFGEDAIRQAPPTMGGEDFAVFAKERPSCFAFLGTAAPGETPAPLHHPRFLPEEEVLWRGSALLASMPFVALSHLG